MKVINFQLVINRFTQMQLEWHYNDLTSMKRNDPSAAKAVDKYGIGMPRAAKSANMNMNPNMWMKRRMQTTKAQFVKSN